VSIRNVITRFKNNPFAVQDVEWRRDFPRLADRLPGIIGLPRYNRIANYLLRQWIKPDHPSFISNMVACMGRVMYVDLLELFAELKTDSILLVKHLSGAQVSYLREQIAPYENCDELPKDIVDQLMQVLVPVNTLDDLFLNEEKPVLNNGSALSGERIDSVRMLVLYLNYVRMVDNLSMPEYAVILGKRIVDREPLSDTIIPHPHGYYRLVKTISADKAIAVKDAFRGGAYIMALQTITKQNDHFHHGLFCRGTRAPMAVSGFRTWCDNLRACQGADGIMLDFPQVNELLDSPSWQGKPVWIGGMSLGGAHAQILGVAMMSTHRAVSEIMVISGVGLDELTLNWYRHLPNKPKLTYVQDALDPVPLLGHGHLGYECSDQVVDFWIIVPTGKDLEYLEDFDDPDAFMKAYSEWHRYPQGNLANLLRLFRGLGTVHSSNRLWYEEKTEVDLLHFSSQYPQHGEVVLYLLNNTLAEKQGLEQARQKCIIAKHHNKVVDFLAEISGKSPAEVFEALEDQESVCKYVRNRQNYLLGKLKRNNSMVVFSQKGGALVATEPSASSPPLSPSREDALSLPSGDLSTEEKTRALSGSPPIR